MIDCELGQVVLWKGSPLRAAIETDLPSASGPDDASVVVSLVSAETDAAVEVGSFPIDDRRRWIVEVPTEAVAAGTYQLATSLAGDTRSSSDLTAAGERDALSEQFIVLDREEYHGVVTHEDEELFVQSSSDLTPDEVERLIRDLWMDRLGSSRLERVVTRDRPVAGTPTNVRVRAEGEARAFRAVEIAWIIDRLTALVQLLAVGEPWRAQLEARVDGFSALVWLSLVVDLPIPLSNRLAMSLSDEQIGEVTALRRVFDHADVTYAAVPGTSEFRLTLRMGGEAVTAETSLTREPPFVGEGAVGSDTIAEVTAVDE